MTKLIVDPAPDAQGYWTIRWDNGSEHGDTEAQPIATVYSKEMADNLVGAYNEPGFGEAEEFLTHNGVTIYHAYKNQEDTVEGNPLGYWYSTSAAACNEEYEFDVRELPFNGTHEERIKKAIDAGLLKEETEPTL